MSDAGSPDGTASLAERAGATVVASEKGRGPQLHAGARACRGDVLLFLHADARLPPQAREAMLGALADETVGGGNFLLRFDPCCGWARLFTWANDVRRRTAGIYYGDSAIFVRRSIYEELGGFRPLPILEDYDLVRRLERRTRTAYVRHVVVTASARRFASSPVRTLGTWALVQGLYTLGVSPSRLARLYADVR